jgi:hypothetical protein
MLQVFGKPLFAMPKLQALAWLAPTAIFAKIYQASRESLANLFGLPKFDQPNL